MPWPFSNHHHQSSGGERLDDDEPVDVHSWGDKETHIRVTNPEGFAVKVRVGGKMEGGGERAPGERKGTRPEKNYSFLSIFPNRRPLVTKPTSTPFYFFFPPSLFFASQVEAHARVDLPHDEVFAILTAPDNHEVFSSIVAIPYRKVLRSNEFLGTRQVAVDHEGRWRLGIFGGKVKTRLLVDEDGRSRTVRFTLRDGDGDGSNGDRRGGSEGAKGGSSKAGGKGGGGSLRGGTSFMSRFEGGWRVAPLSQSALDAALRVRCCFVSVLPILAERGSGREGKARKKEKKEKKLTAPHPLSIPLLFFSEQRQVKKNPFEAAATSLRDAAEASPLLRALRRGGGGGGGGAGGGKEAEAGSSTTSSLVSLDHALAPSFAPPPPFDRVLFAAIAGKQVRVLIEDLRKEAERRKSGTETTDGKGASSPSLRPSSPKSRRPPFPPLLW